MKFFCSKVTLSSLSYNNDDLDIKDDKIVLDDLGMGVAEMWRGIPDGRLRGSALYADIPIISGHKQRESSGSNGTSVVCEAKLKISKRNLPQLIKTCVVSSFIEKNLHPGLNSMVPTILLDTEKAIVVLYCAENDLLLVSDAFRWKDDNTLNMSGITFLWAMINHRYEDMYLVNPYVC